MFVFWVYKIIRLNILSYSIVKKMQETDTRAADPHREKKEKVEIELILPSLWRFALVELRDIGFSRRLEYQKTNAPEFLRMPRRDKGKGSSGRNGLRNFARETKIPSCAPTIDPIQCNTLDPWTREIGRRSPVSIRSAAKRQRMPGVAGAASRKLTISHRYARRSDQRSPSGTAARRLTHTRHLRNPRVRVTCESARNLSRGEGSRGRNERSFPLVCTYERPSR